MSKIGKRLIAIPSNVNINLIDDNVLTVQGIKGTLTKKMHALVKINICCNDNNYVVNLLPLTKELKSVYMYMGTTNSLINNMIKGVSDGFKKTLQLIGVGYKASIENNVLFLTLGFSHIVNYIIPNNITISIIGQNEIAVSGIDKELVGQVSANIRNYKKPDIYKGKGIRYFNENIITKDAKKK